MSSKCSPPQVRSCSGREPRVRLVAGEAGDELAEVGAGEAPVEGLGDLVVAVLELVEGAGEEGEILEVVRLQ